MLVEERLGVVAPLAEPLVVVGEERAGLGDDVVLDPEVEDAARGRDALAELDVELGKGISTSGCVLDLGIEHNIVAKSGSFFSYDNERLGQGRNNAKAFLDEHQEIAKEIEGKVYEALGIGQDLVKPIEQNEATDTPPVPAAEAVEAA